MKLILQKIFLFLFICGFAGCEKKIPVLNSTHVEFLPDDAVISNQETVRAGTGTGGTVTVQGIIAPDETRTATISARAAGRIEKLYVRYNYQFVNKGQKILELYSPELSAATEEYLFLRRQGNKELLQNSRQKLFNLGISDSQIHNIEQSERPLQRIVVYAPQSGYAFIRENISPTSALNEQNTQNAQSMGMQMGSSAPSSEPQSVQTNATGNFSLREGMFLNRNQELFAINDFSTVWGMIFINTKIISSVQTGAMVKIITEKNSDTIMSHTDYVEPIFLNGQQFLRVHVHLNNNKKKFQVGSFFQAELQTVGTSIQLPSQAIYDLGERKIVWIKTGVTKHNNKIFQPREVKTGSSSNGITTIASGLKPEDEVALDAGYMLDSETIIR